MANPLKSFLDVRRNELPLVALMFLYFFSVITTFWIVKPLKKARFVGFYKESGPLHFFGWDLSGPQAEQLAKVSNMLVAFLAVVAFTWFARRLRRAQLTLVFGLFCVAVFLLFAGIGTELGGVAAWALYLFGDLYNTLMVATFFAFLNDSFAPETAKRVYGPIILGGVAGGAFGSLFVQAQVDAFAFQTWMLIASGITLAVVGLAGAAGRLIDRSPPPEVEGAAPVVSSSNAALEGAQLVLRSPYLLSVVAIVGLYEIVSTVLDFQFTSTVVALVPKEDLDNAFTSVFALTNGLSLVVQLVLTGFILARFKHTVALLIMPVAVLSASLGYLVVPTLFFGSALSVADNALNYSINQSAREALYTPTTRDEKYKAKAFIDMFVQRFAKALAVGVNLLISGLFAGDLTGMRYLSLFVVAVVAVWILAARYAGRRFEALVPRSPPP